MFTRKIVLWLALASTFSGILSGQSFTAAVRGVVTDSSQAAVPAATVVMTNVDRNTEHRTETDALGRYVLTALPPGTYTFKVEATGFQRYERSSFRLDVQQQATVDVELHVGEVTTSVTVESAAPLLNTTNANLGQVIENRYIEQLPLINRNVMLLAYMTPGVTGVAGAYYDSWGPNFSAAGTRNSTADVIMDGMSTTNSSFGATQVAQNPPVDSIEEFKVQTSFFSAEFGNSGAAVVNMVTKSGTNQYHGTGSWYYRNAVLNANNFFSNRAGTKRPDYHRHLYGGTFGGPIRKDKTFFFVTYERLPTGTPSSYTATFPTLQQRQGDFTDYVTASGQPIIIYNPFDTYTNAAGDVKRRPFAGNIIPKSMMDPVALAAASYYPEPNQPGINNNWYKEGVTQSVNNQMEAKGDHNFTEKDRISVRYTFRRAKYLGPEVFGAGAPGIPWEITNNTLGSNNPGVDYTRVHSARTVFNVRFGILRPYADFVQLMKFDMLKLGFPQYMKDAALKINPAAEIFPRFNVDGYTAIGNPGWGALDRRPGTNQLTASMTRISGSHNLKVGGEYRRNFFNFLQPNNPAGSFGFGRQTTSQDRFTGSPTEGNAFASMLLGWGTGSAFDHQPRSYSNDAYFAWYFQDDWKLTRKLTLNLGLRYDVNVPRWDREYRESYWNLGDPSPLAGKVPGMDLRGFLAFCDENTRSPFNADTNNLQPRVGLAYSMDDKTSIRAGYGTYYTVSRAAVTNNVGTGFTSSSYVEWSRDSNLTRYATLSNPYPDGLNLPPGRSLGAMTFIGMGVGAPTRENVTPFYHSWTFSVQRQLPGASLVEVNYAGTKGVHQYVSVTNLQMLDPMYWGLGRTALNQMVPNPFYGVITDTRSSLSLPTVQRFRLLVPYPQYNGASRQNEPTMGDSNFHSVQFKFERRFSGGLAMLAHYTISKSMDNFGAGISSLTWLGGSVSLQDMYNLKNERALGTSDIPQRLVLTFSYDLPIGKGKAFGTDWGRLTNALLGGWQIGSFMTFQSGVPLRVTQSGGTLWNGATQRPDLIGDPNPGGSVVDRLNAYFNPAAFSKPAADVLGTAPRMLNYRAPGIRNADISMLKAFQVREGMQAEARFELQNATNSPSFSGPSTGFGSTSFGMITGYKGNLGPREAQVGLKFRF